MELKEHQQVALDCLRDRCIYGDGAGTGKTITSLVWADGRSDKVLILASSQEILDHWVAEGEKWSDYLFLEMVMGAGTARQREKARDYVADCGTPVALVLNYEAVWRDIEPLIALGFTAVICDEAHHLKGRQTATFKAVDKLARRVPNLLLVTGTPIMNRADEAWSMLHLLEPQNYTSYWKWVDKHFDIEVTDFHGTVKRPVQLIKGLKPGHAELVREELAPRLLQRSYDEIFPNTPAANMMVLKVELGPEERETYNSLVRKSWTKVGEELVITENEVAKTTRLRQLTSSWASINADMDYPGAKIDGVVHTVTIFPMDQQILILSAYQETARRIAQELGEDCLSYTGDMSKYERRQIMEWFKNGDLRILSATIGTLGEGVDGLDVADRLIMVDRDWTPARNEQIVARLRRAGKERTVHVVVIEAQETIDQAVSRALDRKDEIVRSLL